jgi:hypothetical protein
MNKKEIRRPSPVLSIAREMKNAGKTIQTMGSAYPASASPTVNAPVRATAVTAIRTMAPAGIGCTIDPTMVEAKIAKRFQD